MTREHEAKVAASQAAPQNKWLVPYPILQEKKSLPLADAPLETLIIPYSHTLSAGTWPTLPTITEMTENSSLPHVGSPAYIMQSLDSMPMEEDRMISEETRCSTRLVDNANKDIMEKVTEAARKRDLEGTVTHPSLPVQNSFVVISNNELVLHAQKLGFHIHDNNFSSVDMLRDLENARSDLSDQNINKPTQASILFIENSTGETTPLSMDWANISDNEDPFIIVESREKNIC
jgi:hypothetical protein